MTKNVVEKAMIFTTNLYQSDVTKSTERNNTEPYNTCDQHTFLRYFSLAGQSISSKICLH